MFGSVERLVAVPALLLAFGIVGVEWIATTRTARAPAEQTLPARPRPTSAPTGPPGKGRIPLAAAAPAPVPAQASAAAPPPPAQQPAPSAGQSSAGRPTAESAAGRPWRDGRREPHPRPPRPWRPSRPAAGGARPAAPALGMERLIATARSLMPHGAFGFGPIWYP